MFYGKVIVDLYAVARNNVEKSCVPLIQLPAMVTSCKTIVKYNNQDTENDIVKTRNSSSSKGSLMLPSSFLPLLPSQPLTITNLFFIL